MPTRVKCEECGGEGLEAPDYFEPCPVCNGRGWNPGRPDEWPAVGARLARAGTGEILGLGHIYTLTAAPIIAGMIPAELDGERVNLNPDDLEAGRLVVLGD